MRFAQKSPFAGISPLGMTGRIHQGKVSRNAGIGLSLYARYPSAGGRNASGKAPGIAGMSGYALVKVVCALGVDHRADDGEFVHHPGHPRKLFANLNTGHVCRNGFEFSPDVRGRFGLEIEHVLMGRTAGEQNVDDRLVRATGSGAIFGLQKPGQGRSRYAERANGKKGPAGQAVAKFTRRLSK